MTKENFTSLNVILDRSGSMSSIAKETIEGYNSFVTEQQKLDGDAVLTLAIFDEHYELIHDCVALKDVKPLTDKVYFARGYTSLLDAVGKTINATGAKLAAMAEEDRPSKVLFLIMTDGQENASKEYFGEKIKKMINHQRDNYKWEFVFIGANQDAITAGASLGVAAANSYAYTANAGGAKRLFDNVTRGTSDYRVSTQGVSYNMVDPTIINPNSTLPVDPVTPLVDLNLDLGLDSEENK